MKNNKGQALVEFIIILPIFIMLMLAVFDYVRIIRVRSELESLVEDVILDENKTLDSDIKVEKDTKDNYLTYTLSKEVDITSPVLSKIISNKYDVKISRSIYE